MEGLREAREKRRYHHLAGESALAKGDAGEANDPQHLPIWYALASAYLRSGHSAGAQR